MASTAVKNNGLSENSNKKMKSSSKEKAGTKSNRKNLSADGSNKSNKSNKSDRSGSRKNSSSKKDKSSKSDKSASRSGSVKKSTTKSGSKKGLPRSETIKLACGADIYYVSARHFAACSNLIKKELAVNSHARSVDLRQFDKTTVRVLAEYIESKKIKTDISFYSLAELLKFSKVFEMENLRTQLEKFITTIAENDLATLHQVLLIIGVTTVSRPTEKAVLQRAAKNFTKLAATNTFQRVPFNIAIALFARCDLNVTSEIQVVDAMLLWLAGQPNPPTVVPALFYLVRHDFLHSIQKAFVVERARALRFADDVVSVIERCFECRSGARICVLRDHHDAKYARCGVPDPSLLDAKNPDMPLSLPREAIFFKPSGTDSSCAPTSDKRSFHSSEARPFYHAPPACAGSKNSKSSKRKDAKKAKGQADAKKNGKNSQTKSASSKRASSSSRSDKSGKQNKKDPKSSNRAKKAPASDPSGKSRKINK